MIRVAFVTLGCKLNYAETATVEREFIARGCTVVHWQQGADIFVVNTCSVTETSDRKCRSVIRKLHRISPDAKIAVMGCYAHLKGDYISTIDGVRYVFDAKSKGKVAQTVLSDCDAPTRITGCSRGKEFFPAFSSGEDRTRAFLKVQDGCDYHCTYCTVWIARGESRNAPIADIVEDARRIASQGITEIVLTGVNTGDFGKSTGESFLDLLKALQEIDGIERYRISSIEPNLLTPQIVDWITSGTKFMPHFHIPLQSGSDEILARMGRRYTSGQFAQKLSYVRDAFARMYARRGEDGADRVFFGVDVIVGFPGESEEHFMETYRLLERVRPAYLHVFPYSPRRNTIAAAMKEQIPEPLKDERVGRLMELSDRLHGEFVEANRGRKAKVLFESSNKHGFMYGYTDNYIRIERPYDAALSERIVEVEI